MAKICDLTGNSKSSLCNNSAILLQMASIMRCGINEVREKILHFGGGHIYTANLIVLDTPANRRKLTDMYGVVAIMLKDGTIIVRDRNCRGSVGRKRRAMADNLERRQYRTELAKYNAQRKTERNFAVCQGERCPKRQGKAYGIPCVFRRSVPLNSFTTHSENVFVTIRLGV